MGELHKRIGKNSKSRRMGVLTHREEDPTNLYRSATGTTHNWLGEVYIRGINTRTQEENSPYGMKRGSIRIESQGTREVHRGTSLRHQLNTRCGKPTDK